MVGDDNTILSSKEIDHLTQFVGSSMSRKELLWMERACRIAASHEALRASRQALLDALARYGRHKPLCLAAGNPAREGLGEPLCECTCGYEDVREVVARESVHDETEEA